MIRNLVLFRLKPGADPEAVEEVLASLRALRTPGLKGIATGLDARLRDGNWDGGLISDFEDAAAYQAYDADDEHLRIRQRLGAFVETLARTQFEI